MAASIRLATMDVIFQTKGYEGVRQHIERIQLKGGQTAKSLTGIGTAGTFTAGRLRGLQNQLIILSGSLFGVQGRLGSVAASLLSFGVGGAVGAAAAAGIAGIAFAYKKLTASTREVREEQEKLTAAALATVAALGQSTISNLRSQQAALWKDIGDLQRKVDDEYIGNAKQKEAWEERIVLLKTNEAELAAEIARLEKEAADAAARRALQLALKGGGTVRAGVTTGPYVLDINANEKLAAGRDAIRQMLNDPTGGGDLRFGGAKNVEDTPLGMAFTDYYERLGELNDALADTLRQGIAQTLGNAIYQGFAAAFETGSVVSALEAFGRAILAGIGAVFVQLGEQLIAYGIVMAKLMPFLLNIFTSGPAAIAAGAALVALGSTFQSIASGRGAGGSGPTTGGTFREPRGAATEDFTTRQILWGPGAKGIQPARAITFNVFGPADPAAQRAIIEAVKRGTARGIR